MCSQAQGPAQPMEVQAQNPVCPCRDPSRQSHTSRHNPNSEFQNAAKGCFLGGQTLCAQGKDCHQLTGPSHHDPLLLHSTPTSIACALLTTAPGALPPPPHSSKPRSFLIPPLLLLKTAFKSGNWCQQVMPHPRARLASAPSHPWPCRLPPSPLAGPGGRAHTKGFFGSGNNRRPGGAGSPRSHRLGWLWQK